jgi:hypothetical protein
METRRNNQITNITHISRDDFLDATAERKIIAAYRQDGIEECLYEDQGALGWAIVARGGHVRTGYGVPEQV